MQLFKTTNTVVVVVAMTALVSAVNVAVAQSGSFMTTGVPFIGTAVVGAQIGSTSGSVPTMDDLGGDVIVADLQSIRHFASEGGISAFAMGTTACNVGTDRVNWIAITNEHPVIAQSVHRLMDNRFEQIGLSWVWHGFYAVSQSLCSPCVDPVPTGQQLGVGCSDPTSATLNGVQTKMSPRSGINAHTGFFDFPWEGPDPQTLIERRLQVHDTDLDPALNVGARYFIEGFYITADESSATTRNNSASYREVLVQGNPVSGLFDFVINHNWSTEREQPAVRAWQDVDPAVVETDIQIPDEGLFILAAKATEIGPAQWRYSYALQNLNSDRSGQSFSVPLPDDAVVTNIGFHDVDYHSGEPYDLSDWTANVSDDAITWSTENYAVDQDANALRFGTVYSFYFDGNMPPTATTITLELFKPGAPAEVNAETIGPGMPYADCNANGVADDCDIDCATPGCVDPCGTSADANDDGIPDECEAAVSLDIRPGTCPNPLNVRSRGVVPVAITGNQSFDVTDIDFTSLALTRADGIGGVAEPIMRRPGKGMKIEDVTTPSQGELCACEELSGDGIDDLLLKFSTAAIVSELELGSVPWGTPVELKLSGSLLDGTMFEAWDCIVITGKPRQRDSRQHRVDPNRR